MLLANIMVNTPSSALKHFAAISFLFHITVVSFATNAVAFVHHSPSKRQFSRVSLISPQTFKCRSRSGRGRSPTLLFPLQLGHDVPDPPNDDNDAPETKSRFRSVYHHVTSIGRSAALAAAIIFAPATIQIHPQTAQINDGHDLLRGSNHVLPTICIEKTTARAALTENQQLVADTWFAVTAQFFDQTFHGLGEDGWRQKEREAIRAVADTGPDDEEVVDQAIRTMLAALGDPYTRYLPREKYEALTNYATGGKYAEKSAGIGVQLLEDPKMKEYVMVVATSAGGPAEEAGVQSGDIILEVNGESMEGATAEVVAAKCRGEAGENVQVVFLRRTGDGSSSELSKEKKTLTRRSVRQANPITTSTFVSAQGKSIGVIKIPSFSTETVNQLVDGLRSLTSNDNNQKLDAIAIDIRGNVGGYMPAGVDAAKLFLPARAHIIAEVDQSGKLKGYDADGIGAETSLPIYLVVDKRTASASEIFAAALQDNNRAIVVGVTNTFGKGRIQNVQPLENGGGVAVTRARYVTPKGRDLHGVGIVPNRHPTKCESNDSVRTCLADVV
ncbi:hypothetical protein ACHAXS_013944 [Conticribra weissflogii]